MRHNNVDSQSICPVASTYLSHFYVEVLPGYPNFNNNFYCPFILSLKLSLYFVISGDFLKNSSYILLIGNIRRLLVWIKDNLLKERPELFIQGESV